MDIRYKTTSVGVEKSIMAVEKRLAEIHAMQILKSFENGKITGLAFILVVNNRSVPIKLPVKSDQVIEYLKAQVRKPRKDTYKTIEKMADRIAWKLLAEWVEIQASFIKLRRVDPLEPFLAYVYDGGTGMTLFEKMKAGNFKALPMPEKEKNYAE